MLTGTAKLESCLSISQCWAHALDSELIFDGNEFWIIERSVSNCGSVTEWTKKLNPMLRLDSKGVYEIKAMSIF